MKTVRMVLLSLLVISVKSSCMDSDDSIGKFMSEIGAREIASGTGFRIFVNDREEKPKHPPLSFFQCGTCKKECSLKCTRCKGAYYCSEKCQRNAWPTHKTDCTILADASRGDQYQMERFLIASIEAARNEKLTPSHQDKASHDAFAWFSRLILRNLQDGICNKNLVAHKAVLLANYYYRKIKNNSLSHPFSTINPANLTSEAIDWIHDIKGKASLVPPCSLKHLAANFVRPKEHDASLFEDPEHWPLLRNENNYRGMTKELLELYQKKATKKANKEK